MGQEYILQMDNVVKRFPGTLALDHVSLRIKPATVHAIMGENGAGKSTMMKILLGIYHADEGTINFKGITEFFKSPHAALESGISMIHQELNNIPHKSVAENIFLGKEILRNGLVSRREMIKETQKLFDRLNIQIDPRENMGKLSVAKQQLCEIAKAVSYDSDLIIMDEPTSAITETEVKHLFEIIERLKSEGKTIIYITHKMDEVFSITDEISVYRDGKYIDTIETAKTTRDELISKMVGRKIVDLYPKEEVPIGDVILEVQDLSAEKIVKNVNFSVRRGEILGIAGLMGAGRSEIMETLFGIRKKKSGKVIMNGKEIRIKTPHDAIKNKISFLTEDRKKSGLFLTLSVRRNTYVASLKKHSKGIFVNNKLTIKNSLEMKEKLSIKTPTIETKVMNLSGGNQQKVIVGRWLLTDPDVLIFDEPTRGIDVGSKSEIYKLMSECAKNGTAIIMISSEMPELLNMSDRILVVGGGTIVGELGREEATQEKILDLATINVQ